MPSVPSGGANAMSMTESSSKIVFPAEEELRGKIPLWMKFYCYEYSSSTLGRAGAYNRSGGGKSVIGTVKELAQIFVPAPVNFMSQTTHNYNNAPTTSLTALPPGIMEVLEGGAKMIPGSEKIMEAVDGVLQLYGVFEKMIGDYGGFSQEIAPETLDTTYTPSGASRSFEVRMNLPCLSERDSMAAGMVIRAFEALSLPTIRSAFGYSTKYYAPPVWVFGIGPGDSFKFDPDWTGFPQVSVLRSISHKKTAFETNSLAALGHQGLLKPVAYTLSLVFQELEPAFRQTNPAGGVGLNIINRSTAIVTTGSTAPVKVTGG